MDHPLGRIMRRRAQVLGALNSTLLVERRTPSRGFHSFGYVDFIATDNERQDIKAVSVQARHPRVLYHYSSELRTVLSRSPSPAVLRS